MGADKPTNHPHKIVNGCRKSSKLSEILARFSPEKVISSKGLIH
jgi:hypothetical protein